MAYRKKSGAQGDEGWKPERVFQLLIAVVQLLRALVEGAPWDNWPHL